LLSLFLSVAVAGLWVLSGFRNMVCWHIGGRDSAGVVRIWIAGAGSARTYFARGWMGPSIQAKSPGYYGGIGPSSPAPCPWWMGSTTDGFGLAGFYWNHVIWVAGASEQRLLAIPDWF